MRVLLFGTYDADAHPRVAVLRDGLRLALEDGGGGHTIDECNAPLGLSTAARVSMLRRPWLLPQLASRLARAWATLIRRVRRRPRPDVVVVGYLGHFDVLLARRLFRRSTVVLDHLVGASDTARDRGVKRGLRQRLLRTLDERALSAADVVVVDTEEHRAALPEQHRDRAVVVAVGAPAGWFAAPRDDGTVAHASTATTEGTDRPAPLRVVFFGLYTPLQGTPVIGGALGQLADDAQPIEVTMIGSGQDLERARRLAAPNRNVTWIDWVQPVDLPTLVAEHDVCLGIFGTGPKALRVVPNKVYQGAAAGTAIITSDTAPQRRVLGHAATFVPPGDAAALADALRHFAARPDELAAARAAAHRLALQEFAADRVVAPLIDRLRRST
jgi:glycosyltransferase involved in cell wall biosynthesis